MNELIKELEKQCWDHQTNHLDSKKFAELILKECLKYIDDSFGDIDYVKFMIKRNFGVEE